MSTKVFTFDSLYSTNHSKYTLGYNTATYCVPTYTFNILLQGIYESILYGPPLEPGLYLKLPGASRSLSLQSAVSSLQSVVFNLQSTVFLSTVCRLQSSDINLVFILFTEIIMSETWIQTSQVIAWDKGGTGRWERRVGLWTACASCCATSARYMYVCVCVYFCVYIDSWTRQRLATQISYQKKRGPNYKRQEEQQKQN